MALREQEDGRQGAEAWYLPEPASVRSARRFVADVLQERGIDAHDAALLVSELAANAVDHARTPFTVAVRIDRTVRVELGDESDNLPVLTNPSPTSERGRGLAIVRAMSVRWGVELRPGGKAVWFEVPFTAG